MIPQANLALKQDFELVELPTRTFQMRTGPEIVAGFVDRLAGMEQAIYLILSVERYEYLIHSWNYGVELADLFGQPVSFCLPEIKRRVTEALMQDDRITGVGDFGFEVKGGKVRATFVATTIFGEVNAEKEVNIA